MTITHSFTSTKSDGGDATVVKPSDWNADHVVSGSIVMGTLLEASKSTHMGLSAGSTTGNPGAGDMSVGSGWFSGSNYRRAGIMEFDISSLAGKTILSANLELTVTNWSNVLTTQFTSYLRLIVTSILRNFNETQVTWDVYSTGNNWQTAGGDGANDKRTMFAFGRQLIQLVQGDSSFPANTLPSMHEFDVTKLVRLDLGDAQTASRFSVRFSHTTGSENAITVAGRTNATTEYRPKLRVIYLS